MGLFSFTDLSTHVNRKYGDRAGRKLCTITARVDCSIPSLETIGVSLISNMFAGSESPKCLGSPNISLVKYQLLFFFFLLFAEKINSLLNNQQKNSHLKLVWRRWKKSKQNLVEKIFVDHQIICWFGSRKHVNHDLMASIWEKAISILAGYLNSSWSYLITAVFL